MSFVVALAVSPLGQFSPEFFQRHQQAGIVTVKTGGAYHDNQVEPGKKVLMLAETFPNQTFEAVSINRSPGLFFCYGQAQPGRSAGIGMGKNREVLIRGLAGLLEDPLVLRAVQQANGARETESWCGQTPAYYCARRARPLARRALMTLRPPLVAIRARKP